MGSPKAVGAFPRGMGVRQYARYIVIAASGHASGMNRVCNGYASGMHRVCIGVRIKCSPFLSNWVRVVLGHAHKVSAGRRARSQMMQVFETAFTVIMQVERTVNRHCGIEQNLQVSRHQLSCPHTESQAKL